jgi:hypothetical protein
MNFNNLNDGSESPQESGGDQQGGGHELNDALAEQETEFVAAEKKPINQSALMLLAIVVIGAAGMYLMYLKTGPQSAKAADPAAVTAENTIATFMKGGSGNIALLRSLLENTAKVVEQFKIYPNVAQIPLSDLKGNPFHLASAKPPPGEDPAEIAKKKKEEERLAVTKAVQALQLQTLVIRGNRKACMINNTLYQEGETVDIFTVDKITQSGVVVKSGSFRFELKMSVK